jgi:hypothetical protein
MKKLTEAQHPVVMAQPTCRTSVDRLKYGPANIPEVIMAGAAYTDTTFEGKDQLYWSGFTSTAIVN